MSTTARLPLPWTTVYSASSSTSKFIPATGWLSSGRFNNVRVSYEVIAYVSGSNFLTIVPAYQVANVPNTILSTAVIGSTVNADGVNFPSGWTDISTTSDDAQLLRFGWQVVLSSGSALSLATVGGSIEYVTA